MLRRATPEDVPAILRMAHAMVADSTYAPLGVDEDRMRAFLGPLISHGFVVVVEKAGAVVGAMLGDVVVPWYGVNRMGVEYVVYLEPEHRHGLTAARMVGAWVDWCKRHGAVQCRAGVTAGNASLERLYVALGFERSGGSFVKNL